MSPDTSHCLFISLLSSSTEPGIPKGRVTFEESFSPRMIQSTAEVARLVNRLFCRKADEEND